ncbi:hypothetical protein M1615_02685 [Patescibacteria group bacterium]|nr:hypothetical protein [Patescibacteria group bacterium]
MKEKEQSSWIERNAKWIIPGGIIAGIIGLVALPELAVLGFGVAGLEATGVIYERAGKKKKTSPQAV